MSDQYGVRRNTAVRSTVPSPRAVRIPGRIWLAAVTGVLALVATACGSTVAGVSVDGTVANPTGSSSAAPTTGSTDSTEETPAPTTSSSDESTDSSEPSTTGDSGSSSSAGADDAKLYPTAPIPYNATPNTAGIASLMESRRLAGYVLDPSQIDATLTDFVPIPTFPLPSADTLSAIFPDESTQLIARRQGMYAGYSGTRSDPTNKSSMVLAVFVFPSAAAAQKASSGMATASTDKTDTVVKYSDLPGALGNQGADGTTSFSGQAFIASGSAVVYVYVSGGVSQKATVPQRMKAALVKEVATLKKYVPTPTNKLMSQKFDPSGLYARTLPPPKNYTVYGTYSLQGALHTQTDAAAGLKVLSAAGVDVVTIGRSVLYRAKDAAAAGTVRDAFYAQEVTTNSRYRDFDPGTSAGAPRCLQDSVQSQYVCYATVDRVTIEYSSQSEADLKRSLETQVALLQQ